MEEKKKEVTPFGEEVLQSVVRKALRTSGVYRSTAAYGRNNERALPVIAVIIESRYEIRAVKICRKLREAAGGHKGTVRNARERGREKVLYVNYVNLRDCFAAVYGGALRVSRCSCCDLPENCYHGITTRYKYQ